MGKSMKPGGGGRFAKLKGQLAKKGASNPGALAAYIGRKKYGAKKFGQMSHKGNVMNSFKPMMGFVLVFCGFFFS